MIRDEKDLQQQSFKTGLFGCLLMLVISLIFKNITFVLGYILGFAISQFITYVDIVVITELLASRFSKTFGIFAAFFVFKLGIYAIGFLIAVKIPVYFCLYTVAIGYLTTKLTIYRLAMTRR